jgi:hypothetical protein
MKTLIFYLLFYMGVKPGLSRQGKKTDLRLFEDRVFWRIFGPKMRLKKTV